MLRRRSTLIWLTAVTLCFVAIVSANAADGAEWLDDRYDDEGYFVIDCYMDSNGDTWLLLWDWLDDSTVFVPSRMGPRKDPHIETFPLPE